MPQDSRNAPYYLNVCESESHESWGTVARKYMLCYCRGLTTVLLSGIGCAGCHSTHKTTLICSASGSKSQTMLSEHVLMKGSHEEM